MNLPGRQTSTITSKPSAGGAQYWNLCSTQGVRRDARVLGSGIGVPAKVIAAIGLVELIEPATKETPSGVLTWR